MKYKLVEKTIEWRKLFDVVLRRHLVVSLTALIFRSRYNRQWQRRSAVAAFMFNVKLSSDFVRQRSSATNYIANYR